MSVLHGARTPATVLPTRSGRIWHRAALPAAIAPCPAGPAGPVAIGGLSGLSGLSWACGKRRRRLHRRRAEGRPVSVVVEETDRHELPGCSTEWMDSLLQQRAIEVLFSGVERTELQEDGQVYLFFPRMDIGPYTSQVRMTCQILQEKANRADVKVLAINPGLMKDGAIEYLKEFEELLEAKTEIQLRWQDDRRGGLRVYQQALQRFKYYMPTWFPIPDSVTEALLRTFISQAMRAGHEEVFRTLEKEAKDAGLA